MNKLMHAYDLALSVEEVSVYGFGPWYQSVSHDDQSWNVIIEDWTERMNSAILALVKDWRTVVQGGGHQGLYPFLLSNMFDHVITFEPNPINFFCLTKNCQRANITKIQAAIGAESGMVSFEQTGFSGQHRVQQSSTLAWAMPVVAEYTVPCLTIDSLNLSHCGFIMLDLENYDKWGIMGAMNTIERFLPVICVEKSHLPANDQAIRALLAPFGYTQVRDFPGDMFFQVLG